MGMLKARDFVGVSRQTFSDAMRNAVEQAQESVGSIQAIEVAPPWHLVLTDQKEIEFRTTVRILYSSNE
jgi:flavin-binding protein dodecin